jgi:hypothetical protein
VGEERRHEELSLDGHESREIHLIGTYVEELNEKGTHVPTRATPLKSSRLHSLMAIYIPPITQSHQLEHAGCLRAARCSLSLSLVSSNQLLPFLILHSESAYNSDIVLGDIPDRLVSSYDSTMTEIAEIRESAMMEIAEGGWVEQARATPPHSRTWLSRVCGPRSQTARALQAIGDFSGG